MGIWDQFLERKKSIALVAGVTLVASLEFSRIYVPDCVDKKFAYKIKYLKNQFGSKLARLGSFLRIGNEPSIIRKLTSLIRDKKLIESSQFDVNVSYD